MEWAYIAGILDGEGYFSLAVNGTSPQAKIGIANTHKELIDLLVVQCGGRIQRSKTPNGDRVMYHWILGTKEAMRDFIIQVLPYLVVKKPQALVMLEYLDLMGGLQKGNIALSNEELLPRFICVARMKELNKYGKRLQEVGL